jgi:hypothetical protein
VTNTTSRSPGKAQEAVRKLKSSVYKEKQEPIDVGYRVLFNHVQQQADDLDAITTAGLTHVCDTGAYALIGNAGVQPASIHVNDLNGANGFLTCQLA